MTPTLVFITVVQLLLLLFAVSLHGAAQAWVAALCGDPTPSLAGGTSLNPLRHFEVMGSLMFPALLLAFGFPVFGWGRPLPVVDANLRRPGWDGILVALAGPAANLLLSAAATVALVVAVHLLGEDARQAAFAVLTKPLEADKLASFPVVFTLVRMAAINACVAAFQLIPLPRSTAGRSRCACCRPIGRRGLPPSAPMLYHRGSGRAGFDPPGAPAVLRPAGRGDQSRLRRGT